MSYYYYEDRYILEELKYVKSSFGKIMIIFSVIKLSSSNSSSGSGSGNCKYTNSHLLLVAFLICLFYL